MIERRLLPVVAAVAALLVLVAIATHGRPLAGRPTIGPDATFFDFLATTLIVCAAAALVFVVYLLVADRGSRGGARYNSFGIGGLVALAVLAAFFAFVLTHENFRRTIQRGTPCPGCAGSPVHPIRSHPAKRGRPAHESWSELAIVLVLVGGVAAYFYVNRDRRIEVEPRVRRLRAAVDDSLDDLRNDPDVRRAIIAAYARMERALGATGMARRPSDAPFEYLERSLVELDAGAGGARRLTELFERAKFSHHELGEPMREQSIAALVAVREDLRA